MIGIRPADHNRLYTGGNQDRRSTVTVRYSSDDPANERELTLSRIRHYTWLYNRWKLALVHYVYLRTPATKIDTLSPYQFLS